MGAWGHGPFENDDAFDWLMEVTEAGDDEPLFLAFGEVVGAGPDAYLEVDSCCAALAAAEMVAALAGRPCAGVPEDLDEWVGLQPPHVARELVVKHRDRALEAVRRVRAGGELAELWAESDERAAWEATLDDLAARLRP